MSGPAFAGRPGLPAALEDWFARRTWQPPPWETATLVAAKAGRRVAVVLPALDEEATVAGVVRALLPLAQGDRPLVDDLVVLDGGSTDRTAEHARAAGARVVAAADALPDEPVRPGKGEVLWRSLAATDADLLVFVDADLVDVDPLVVVGLLGPLLTAEGVHLVKGFYRRPLRTETVEAGSGGGRVTELMARPLLARFAPELSGVVQPLGGEYAATRDLLESVPLAGGYGVEVALLLDTLATRGLDAVAQVDVGVRKHRNRSLLELGVMSTQILATVLDRCAPDDADEAELVQFTQQAGRWTPRTHTVAPQDRPPMAQVRRAAQVRGMSHERGSIVP